MFIRMHPVSSAHNHFARFGKYPSVHNDNGLLPKKKHSSLYPQALLVWSLAEEASNLESLLLSTNTHNWWSRNCGATN